MAMQPFGKKAVPGYTQTEITKRSYTQTWAAKRYPWIQITSLSDGCSGDYVYLSSVKDQRRYEDNYVRPKPIVTGVELKSKGELGTTREATINITAFTDQQLIELQKCFFIPAMGVRVEFGWSEDASGNKTTGPIGGGRSLSDPKATCAIQSKQDSTYDGLQGIVGNFDFSLDNNGYWQCTVSVLGASEALSTTKISENNCNCGREYEEQDAEGNEETSVQSRSQLYVVLKDLFESPSSISSYRSKIGSTMDGSAVIARFNYMGKARTEKGEDDSAWYEDSWWTLGLNDADTTESYVSYATLEGMINRYCMPTKSNEFTLGKLESKDILLSKPPRLESGDPRVCLIPGTSKYSKVATLESGNPPTAIRDGKVVLDNILINVNYLLIELDSVLNGNGELRTFIMNVLNKVNTVCGSPWEFEVISTTEDCLNPKTVPTITVVDAKVYDPAPPYSIPSKVETSVLRDWSISLKLTDSMKTQALYANGAKKTGKTDSGGACGSNAFQPFGLGGSFKSLAAPKAVTPPPCDCEDAPVENEKQPTFSELFENMADEVSDNTTKACIDALIAEYGKAVADGDDAHCKGMILPIEFGFTLDGIGGFVWGQIVTSDRIPEAIRNNYDFQITAVEHSVSDGDWKTTVKTIARYK